MEADTEARTPAGQGCRVGAEACVPRYLWAVCAGRAWARWREAVQL